MASQPSLHSASDS